MNSSIINHRKINYKENTIPLKLSFINIRFSLWLLKFARLYLLLIIFCIFQGCSSSKNKLTNNIQNQKLIISKPRTIITTDGEIDDVNSFIRMLLYANEFKIEGLIITSSMWHYKGDRKGTLFTSEMEMTRKRYGAQKSLRWPGTKWMFPLLDAYEKVYPKLSQHADGFPTATHLKRLVKVGNIDFEGEMKKNTDGSNFIKSILLDKNTEPIYLQVWGGTNTIARALKSIEDDYKNTETWKGVYNRVSNKAIIYTVMDQDATYKKYIALYWPDIKIYYNAHQFWCFGYPWKKYVPDSLQYLLEGAFMDSKILSNRGPLLKQYYTYGDGKKQKGDNENIHGDLVKINKRKKSNFAKNDFISEGDSPAFLHLIDIGLDNLTHPEWGGWGGRLVPSKEYSNRWEDGNDASDYNPYTKELDTAYPQTRWLKAIQSDFAARADWCVKQFKDANHPPCITIKTPEKITAKPGDIVRLCAEATDPDNDNMSYSWWQYREVSTYQKSIALINADRKEIQLVIPNDIEKGQTIHFILSVEDDGTPQLTRYSRVVIYAK